MLLLIYQTKIREKNYSRQQIKGHMDRKYLRQKTEGIDNEDKKNCPDKRAFTTK